MSPFVKEMLSPVLDNMDHRSSKESFFEVLELRSVLKTVHGCLNPSLEKSVKNLTNRSGTISLTFFLSLSHRLSSMMPMDKALGHIKIHDSFHNLRDFPHEFLISYRVLLDGFKASSHDFAIPFFHKFDGSLPHIKSDLHSFEPLPKCLSFLNIVFVTTHDFLFDSELLHHLGGA